MDNNNGSDDDIKIPGIGAAAECSATTIEIKIKTLFCSSLDYPTLRTEKSVPVPELKEQIATVTGVMSENQRLIYRGRVLTEDKLLSDYNVQDGDILHLIVRQPSQNVTPGSQGSSSGHNQGNRSEQGAQDIPSTSQTRQDNISGPQETAPGSCSGHRQGNRFEQEARDIPSTSQMRQRSQDNISGPQGTAPGSRSGHRQGNRSEREALYIPILIPILYALIRYLRNESGNRTRMTHVGIVTMSPRFDRSGLTVDITLRTVTGAPAPSSQSGSQNSGQDTPGASNNPSDSQASDESRAEDTMASENAAPQDTTPSIPPIEETNADEDRSKDGSAQQE